jgi:hypothetical protein
MPYVEGAAVWGRGRNMASYPSMLSQEESDVWVRRHEILLDPPTRMRHSTALIIIRIFEDEMFVKWPTLNY